MKDYDLIVIGSGPGGYVSAIYAAKSGMKTALVEAGELGGTCLNRGCIPTKTLLESSRLFYEISHSDLFGIHVPQPVVHMEEVIQRKDEVTNTIREGIKGLLKGNGVTVYYERAVITSSDTVTFGDGTVKTASHILIATGSKVHKPDIPGINGSKVFTSDDLLSSKTLYKELIIIGGGVIGCEFATMYQEFGSKVVILEYMDRILPNMDREVSTTLSLNLKKKGVSIIPKAMVTNLTEEDGKQIVTYESGGTSATVTGDAILVATGRRAFVEHLFDGVEIEMNKGKIKVNSRFETNVDRIYAVGDVIEGMELAHAASAQGMAAVDYMLGKEPSVNLEVIPACIYTSPEIAVVGLTKDKAKEKGISVKISKYPLTGNSKAMISGDERGYIKLILEEGSERLLGGEIVCKRATDMIGELTTSIVAGLTAKDLLKAIKPHPTYCEGVTEAAGDVYSMAIHMIKR